MGKASLCQVRPLSTTTLMDFVARQSMYVEVVISSHPPPLLLLGLGLLGRILLLLDSLNLYWDIALGRVDYELRWGGVETPLTPKKQH